MSSSDIKRYGSSGVHTVEGNVAGSRAARLSKERQDQQEKYSAKKQAIAQEAQRGKKLDKNFQSHTDHYEEEFKRSTVGLQTAAEFKAKRLEIANRSRLRPTEMPTDAEPPKKKKKLKKKSKQQMNRLSFGWEDEGQEEELITKPKKSLKDPSVDTDFLPDADRERQERQERLRLQKEWIKKQEDVKKEKLDVVYSYWDGSGHRQSIQLEKSTTIGKFLELVRKQLVDSFPELRGVSTSNLIYVKEDLMIPHHFSFYDLIVTKARGKSGPLFHFDVHEDVRLVNDVRVEKDESHPGKVVERNWYEKNKHIFPASRWETYDPSVARSEPYTISGSAK